MNKKIYVSGAITGTADYMERFLVAERHLKEFGYEVINPAKINANLPSNSSYQDYMKVSITLLSLCDSIYMLNGWENSKGAMLEHQHAKTMGMMIFYESEETVV